MRPRDFAMPPLPMPPAEPGTSAWREWLLALMAEHHGPIVERNSPRTYRVTFLYEAEPGVRSVALFTSLTEQGPYGQPMLRIPATCFFWATLTVDDDLVTSYQFGPDAWTCTREEFYALTDEARLLMLEQRADAVRADPANPDRIRPTATDPAQDLPQERWLSVLTMPRSEPAPWAALREGVPTGRLEELWFSGSDPREGRPVWLYSHPATPHEGLVVLMDGPVWHRVLPVQTIVDNLVAARSMAPVAVAMVGQPDGSARDVEYRCSSRFADLLADEILPWAQARTAARGPVVVGGLARGGLAAAHAALTRRDAFDGAIVLSGSLWWSPAGERREWLARQVAPRSITPGRFYVGVGRLETQKTRAHGGLSMIDAHQKFAAALSEAGHDVRSRVFPGGHEAVPHRRTIADAFTWLFPTAEPLDRDARTGVIDDG